MRRWLILWLILAGAAGAAPVPVQSGAHDGFSRLVLPLAPGQDWRAGRSDSGYVLQVIGADGFDLAQVFTRITPDRLSAIDARGDQLLLSLACDCHLVLSNDGPKWLVADIRDGPAPADNPWEASFDTPATAPPIAAAAAPGLLPLLANPAPWLDTLVMAPMQAPDEVLMTDDGAAPVPRSLADGGTLTGAAPMTLATSPEPDLSDIAAPPPPGGLDTQALTEIIARGAAQGMLVPDAPLPHLLPAPAEPALPVAAPPPLPTLPGTPGVPGLAARTAADLTRTAGLAPERCLPDAAFALQDWAASTDFAAEIGARRAALTTERDQLVDRAPEALAMAYLHFGFGAEARSALALTDGRTAERDLLTALAHIVDGLPPPDGTLADQAGCLGAVALWSALARDDIAALTPAERDAAMLAFRALPPMLAAQFAPRLARLHLTTGDAAAARDVLDQTPVALPPDTGMTLLEADLRFAESGPDAAIAALGQMAARDVRMTSSALLRLVHLTLDRGDIPTDAQIALLTAMRFERRGTDVVPDLIAAEFRARLAAENFADAQALLDEAASIAPGLVPAMAEDLTLSAAAGMPDGAFATFAFDTMPENPGPDGANAAAARLIALGFAARAAEVLEPPVIGAPMAERRLLRAAADIALGDPTSALVTLDGMTGDRAAGLRADAYRALGDDGAAMAALGADGRAQGDPAAAWRAGDFTALADAEDPVLQAAAMAMISTSALPEDAPPLAARAELLTDAAATRAMASALLDRFAMPDPAD